jgi:L-2,4-diaminobutyrate transaminase
VARLAAEEGVLVRGLPFIEVNSFSPPLVITPKEIDVGLDRFVKALTAAEPEISRMAEA